MSKKKAEIRCLKLVSGEILVASASYDRKMDFLLSYPIQVNVDSEGNVTFKPWFPTKKKILKLSKKFVMLNEKPMPTLEKIWQNLHLTEGEIEMMEKVKGETSENVIRFRVPSTREGEPAT